MYTQLVVPKKVQPKVMKVPALRL